MLLFSFGLMIVAATLLTTPGSFGFHSEEVVSLYPDAEYRTVGLEESGHVFTPTTDDPQIIFPLAPSRVRSVTVLFESPLEQDTDIQVFYASEGEGFSEGGSTHAVARKNSTECSLALPGERYSAIRLDIDGRAELKQVLTNDSHVMRYATWFCIALLAALAVTAAVFFASGWKAERLYPVCALLLGLLYLTVLTPLSVPDEQHHYQSAYELSNVLLFRADREAGDSAAFDYTNFTSHYNTSAGYSRIAKTLNAPAEAGQIVRIPMPREHKYFPMYLPQALGIALARLLGANFIWTFWLGRLFNLLFYVLCTWWAIRIVPRFKALLSLAALAPMSLHQAASYSYDAFVISLSLLLFALILQALLEEGVWDKRSLAATVAVNTLLTPAKIVYYPISALMLLVPKARFRTRKARYLCILAVLLLPLAVMLLIRLRFVVGAVTDTGSSLNWAGRHNYTAAFLFTHPGRMARLFIMTTLEKGVYWMECAVGYSLSGLTLLLPEWIPIAYIALLFLAGVRREQEFPGLRVRERGSLFAVVLAVGGMVLFSMLLASTSNTSPIIQGVQGRYFIPILPLVFLLANNDSLVLKGDFDKALMMAGIMLDFAVISQILKFTLMNQ